MRLEQIKKIAIAGAGIMGASIAQIFAREGYKVALYDIAEAGIENGRKLIAINQEASCLLYTSRCV